MAEWKMQVEYLPTQQLKPNQANPNEMSDKEFNALAASIEEDGWTVPINVVKVSEGSYEIVGGHHRWRYAETMGIEQVPCVVLDPELFDEDRRKWHMVKQNILHGGLNPEKFSQLYDEMAKKYDADVLKELMGFTSADAFEKLYQGVVASLPPELQKALESSKEEIRTIDDLSIVLNRLFREFGETLPSNFMVFSWGGREVWWVQADARLWKQLDRLKVRIGQSGGDAAVILEQALQEYMQVEPKI